MLCLNESASYAVSPAPVQCRSLILPATGFANAPGKAGRAQNRVIPSKINQCRQKKSFFNSFILTATLFFLHSWEVLIESIKNTKQTQNKLKWELRKSPAKNIIGVKDHLAVSHHMGPKGSPRQKQHNYSSALQPLRSCLCYHLHTLHTNCLLLLT